jgi:transposase
MTAVAAIDADMRCMTRASAACRRLMTIPGVGQLTALAFVAAIDDPSRIRRFRDIGAYFGLVPRRYHRGLQGGHSRQRQAVPRAAKMAKIHWKAKKNAEQARCPNCAGHPG